MMKHHAYSLSLLRPQGLALGLITMLGVVGCRAETPAVNMKPVEAARAHDFLDSMGIIAWIYDDARHTDIVVPRLKELGIEHFRAGLKRPGDNHRGNGEIQLRRTKELGEMGFKITALWHRWYDMETLLDLSESLLPSSLYQLEGPNEPWHPNEKFEWRGEKWPKGAVAYMKDMHAALQTRPALKDIPVLSFSGSTTGYGSIEPWIDYANEHIYPDDGQAITHNNQLGKLIERMRKTNYPTLPIQLTETGYNAGGHGVRQTSLGTQSRGVPRLLFETFRHGVKRTFIYALYVEDDQGFALLNRDGTPRPAFEAIRDIRKLLADGHADAASFTPQPLAFHLQTGVPSVHHLLLQKADGTYVLAIWNDANMWDKRTKKDIENPEVPVQITFARAPSRVVTYRPLTDGTKQVHASTEATTAMELLVPDHVFLLEIKP